MIEFAPGVAAAVAALGYVDAQDAILDSRGRTVRCTPRRRTVMQTGAVGGAAVFRKLRCDGVDAAEREWRWLSRLPELGFAVPTPVCFARAGRASAVVSLALPGRPVAALLPEAGARAAIEYACVVVAPLVSRLHRQGIVFRDMYWNHLFAPNLDLGQPPAFLDVERVFSPSWRWRRWVVKDLAGLVASWPVAADRASVGPALTHAYLQAAGDAAPRLGAGARFVEAVVAKAGRIASRRPRYGA